MRYDTAALMQKVIRLAKVPAGSTYRDAATLLDVASDEMLERVVPELLKVTGGHLMAYRDVPVVAGTTRYPMPERSMRTERLQLMNGAGLTLGTLTLASGQLVDEVLAGRCPPGDTAGYWVPENGQAVVVFNASLMGATSLRFYFRRQPNLLVPTSDCWRIDEVLGDGQLTLAPVNAGDAIHTAAAGSSYDVLKGLQPFGALYEDALLPASGYPSVDFGAYLPVQPSVGDILAPAGFTCLPQLPPVLHGVLASFTAAEIMQEGGNQNGAAAMRNEAEAKLASALSTATPQSDEPETTVNETWD